MTHSGWGLSLVLVALAGCYSSDGLLPDGAVAPHDGGAAADGSASMGDDVWDGYIESFMFRSGSDHVHIVFDPATGDGPRTGVIVFGMGTPPPPVTDPLVGYPPSAFSGSDPGAFDVGPYEGFAYPIVTGSVAGARVRVTLDLAAVWDRWCRLQTPVPVVPGATDYGCLPNTGGGSTGMSCYYQDPVTSAHVAADCGWIALCRYGGSPCQCTATACAAGSLVQISFDFHVAGTDGTGTVDLMGLHNVHLTH